jgi:hypothetical protein
MSQGVAHITAVAPRAVGVPTLALGATSCGGRASSQAELAADAGPGLALDASSAYGNLSSFTCALTNKPRAGPGARAA